jgi:hypothetical protein
MRWRLAVRATPATRTLAHIRIIIWIAITSSDITCGATIVRNGIAKLAIAPKLKTAANCHSLRKAPELREASPHYARGMRFM